MFSPKIQFDNKKGLLNLTAKPVFRTYLYTTITSNDVQPSIQSCVPSLFLIPATTSVASLWWRQQSYIKKPKCISYIYFFLLPRHRIFVLARPRDDKTSFLDHFWIHSSIYPSSQSSLQKHFFSSTRLLQYNIIIYKHLKIIL